MKVAAVSVIFASSVIGVNAVNLESLAGYVNDIPQCALPGLRKGFADYQCSTDGGPDSFDCLCKHVGSLAITISQSGANANCLSDFAQAVGSACGLWELNSVSASEYPAATKALAADLGGKGGSPSTATGKGASPTGATAKTTTSSSALAGLATPVPAAVGIIGGAAAALAALLI